MNRCRDPAGNALLVTVLALFAALAVLTVAVHVGVLLRARAVADGAADHAALAAAGAHAGPAGSTDPHVAAQRVATAMGARVTRCDCDRLPVQVEVAVDLPELGPLVQVVGPVVTASGRARLVPP